MLNRSVITVRVKKPFIEWLKSLSDPCNATIEEVNLDNSAYLIPEYLDNEERDEILAEFFDLIFEEELDAWCTDEKEWPPKRDLSTFRKWFDVEFHCMVFDLVDGPLKDE